MEFFRGNSRIISDCQACSILRTLSGCLYARNCLEFVYWPVMVIQVNCAAISAMLRSSTLVKSYINFSEERIISFEKNKTNHDTCKLPHENNSLITRHQITLHIICINFQVTQIKIQTTKLLILLKFYYCDVHKSSWKLMSYKFLLGMGSWFWISKLLHDVASTWWPKELKKVTYYREFVFKKVLV